MNKTLSLILVLLTFLSSSSKLAATVKPTLASLVRSSHIVLTGTVLEANKLTASESYIVKVKVNKILKGSAEIPSKEFKFIYTRFGKGNINFKVLAETKVEQVFFLKKNEESKEESHKLTDAWFGVEKATEQIIAKVTSLI